MIRPHLALLLVKLSFNRVLNSVFTDAQAAAFSKSHIHRKARGAATTYPVKKCPPNPIQYSIHEEENREDFLIGFFFSDKNHTKLLIQFRVGSINYNARLLLECKFQSHGFYDK